LASDALLTTLHPLLENVLQTVDLFEISSLEAHFSCLQKPRNRMGQYLGCMADVLMEFHLSTWNSIQISLPGKKFPSDQRSAVHFREVGGAL
jgi:hypothetical protein